MTSALLASREDGLAAQPSDARVRPQRHRMASARAWWRQPAAAYCSRKYASSASAARLSTRVLERTA
jgi:hypothetical protein